MQGQISTTHLFYNYVYWIILRGCVYWASLKESEAEADMTQI